MKSAIADHGKMFTSERPAAKTANFNSTGIDAQGFEDVAILCAVGAVSGTSPTLDLKLQESDDDSTYSDVTGGAATQITAANKDVIWRINAQHRKRYLRIAGTLGGTSPSFTLSIIALLGDYVSLPVPQAAGTNLVKVD